MNILYFTCLSPHFGLCLAASECSYHEWTEWTDCACRSDGHGYRARTRMAATNISSCPQIEDTESCIPQGDCNRKQSLYVARASSKSASSECCGQWRNMLCSLRCSAAHVPSDGCDIRSDEANQVKTSYIAGGCVVGLIVLSSFCAFQLCSRHNEQADIEYM